MAICCATPLRNAEIAGPKEYLEPKFYANGEGEPTIGVTYVGVIVEDGKYFKDSDNDKDQYIDADILAKSPSGSYAYKDADGNVYKAWFGLSFE